MNEKQIEKYLVTSLTRMGAEVRKLKFLDRNGAPDRIIMFKGVTFFVELKSHGKELQPHQEREIKRLRAVGQWVYVIDSMVGVESFIRDVRAWTCK